MSTGFIVNMGKLMLRAPDEDGGSAPVTPSYLLMEDGSFLLLEDGSRIVLEH